MLERTVSLIWVRMEKLLLVVVTGSGFVECLCFEGVAVCVSVGSKTWLNMGGIFLLKNLIFLKHERHIEVTRYNLLKFN